MTESWSISVHPTSSSYTRQHGLLLHAMRHFASSAIYLLVLQITARVKVKVTLVQALRLCTGRTAHRGSIGIALLFHDQRH